MVDPRSRPALDCNEGTGSRPSVRAVGAALGRRDVDRDQGLADPDQEMLGSAAALATLQHQLDALGGAQSDLEFGGKMGRAVVGGGEPRGAGAAFQWRFVRHAMPSVGALPRSICASRSLVPSPRRERCPPDGPATPYMPCQLRRGA